MNNFDDFLKVKILVYVHLAKLRVICQGLPHLFGSKWNFIWIQHPYVKDDLRLRYILMKYSFGYILLNNIFKVCVLCEEHNFDKLRYVNIRPICTKCVISDPQSRELEDSRNTEFYDFFRQTHEPFWTRHFRGTITAHECRLYMKYYKEGYSKCLVYTKRENDDYHVDTLEDIREVLRRKPPEFDYSFPYYTAFDLETHSNFDMWFFDYIIIIYRDL